MSKIIINDVDLTELKVKFDAFETEKEAVQKKIKQGASEFIAVNMKVAKKLLQKLLDDFDDLAYDAKRETSSEVEEILRNIKFVSEVSDVQFSLPYYDSQNGYHPEGETYSEKIEEIEGDGGLLNDLFCLLEEMEYEVAEWNSSYC
jgi:hypothetical protein